MNILNPGERHPGQATSEPPMPDLPLLERAILTLLDDDETLIYDHTCCWPDGKPPPAGVAYGECNCGAFVRFARQIAGRLRTAGLVPTDREWADIAQVVQHTRTYSDHDETRSAARRLMRLLSRRERYGPDSATPEPDGRPTVMFPADTMIVMEGGGGGGGSGRKPPADKTVVLLPGDSAPFDPDTTYITIEGAVRSIPTREGPSGAIRAGGHPPETDPGEPG